MSSAILKTKVYVCDVYRWKWMNSNIKSSSTKFSPQNYRWKMALMTMVARVVDGLPLVGTMQDDEQVSISMDCIDGQVVLYT